jgi:hypothetical protein
MMTSGTAAHFQLFATDFDSDIRWRLLSGNNRELGRSANSYPDAESCQLEIKHVLAGVAELVPHVRRREGNVWRWILLDGIIPLAVGGRDYDRQVRCEQAVDLFRFVAPTARLPEVVTLTGSRRWVHPAAGRQPLQLGSAASRNRASSRRTER